MNHRNRAELLCGILYAGVWAVMLNIAHLTFFACRTDGSGARIHILCWALSAGGLYLLSSLLLYRGCSMSILVGADTGAGTALLLLTLRLSPGMTVIEGLLSGLLIAVGLFQACLVSYTRVSVPKLLSQIDVLLLLTAWSAMLYLSTGKLSDLLPYLLALPLDLAAVLLLRIFGQSEEVLYGSPVRGALLCGGLLAVICALLLGILPFLSGGARSVTAAVIDGAVSGLTWAGARLNDFFTWFFSLFPVPEEEGTPITTSPPPAVEQGPMFAGWNVDWAALLLRGTAAVLVLAAMGLAVFLIRSRKKRIKGSGGKPGRRPSAARRSTRSGVLAGRWQALVFALRFRITFFLHRKTPAGLLVWLEQWGKLQKLPRKPGETHRCYFHRLAAHPALAQNGENLLTQLDALSDYLDGQYFGRVEAPFPSPVLRQIHHRFAGVQPPEEPDGKAPAPPQRR